MATPDDIDTEKAVWSLARRLHWKMEHLDPTDRPGWAALTERERDFYRLCVEAILDEKRLCQAALL